MKYELVIIGCGGHARSVLDVALSNFPKLLACFVDENAVAGEAIFDVPVYKDMKNAERYFIAIGNNELRNLHSKVLINKKIDTIVSPKAHVGMGVKIEKGVFIGNFTHIGPEVNLGEFTIINNGVIIEHEVSVGRCCHIAPNASISGRSVIGENVFVGVGASIIDKISVCSNVIIGAGSVVIHDIKQPGTYVGCPVRRIK